MEKTLNVFFLFIFTCCFSVLGNTMTASIYNNAASALVVDTLPNGDLITFQDTSLIIADCSEMAEICIDVAAVGINQYQILDNGVGYSNGIAECNYDTITGYSYEPLLQVDDTGPYILNNWMVNGTSFSGLAFNDISELVDSMNAWDPLGDWGHFPSMEKILGGFPTSVYSSIDIELPDLGGFIVTLENGGNQLTNPKGTRLRFGVGFHEVIFLETNTGCRDTFNVSVSCISPSNVMDGISVFESDTTAIDFTELPGNVIDIQNVCSDLSGTSVNFEIINNTSLVYTATDVVGMDTACIVACDDLGFCDTTYYYISVETPVGFDVVQNTIVIGEIQNHCIDTSIFIAPVESIQNLCSPGSGSVNFTLDPVSYCVSYQGISVGLDTACILVCDTLGLCDTTEVYIAVNMVDTDYVYDTVFLNTSNRYCVDTTQLAGNIDTIYNDCDMNSGEFVNFTVDEADFCVNYQAVDVGKDTACLYLTDENSAVDTTFLVVCVVPPNTEVVRDTILLGSSMNYCVDSLELGGRIQDFRFCDNFDGGSVNIALNSVSLCLEAESVAEGIDTACVVLCDNFNICDTTIYILSVIDSNVSAPPTATPDRDTTSQNSQIVVNVCANDIIPEGILNGTPDIINGPNHGTANFNNDCTVDYTPETDFCNAIDSFHYVICNDLGCDTALVEIMVECPDNREPMHVYNAMSPNGDDKNDTFMVEGIENYPGNQVSVFNRWGNRVFYAENYRNNWNGVWNGNTPLADGTYFYVVDDGQGTLLSGFLHIQR